MNYADIAHEASAREQQMLEVALANRKLPSMAFTGACYWCEESITKGQYCDADCRHDHQVLQWAQSQRATGDGAQRA